MVKGKSLIRESLVKIAKTININGSKHLWKSVKFLCQNNHQKSFFDCKEDFGALCTDGASSKLSNVHTYTASEEKAAHPL